MALARHPLVYNPYQFYWAQALSSGWGQQKKPHYSKKKRTKQPKQSKKTVKPAKSIAPAADDLRSPTKTIKEEIDYIQKSGSFLSEAHYYDLKKKLDYLVNQGVGDFTSYYQVIEKVSPFVIAENDRRITEKKNIESEVFANNSQPSQEQCVSNTAPVFTSDITDLSRISRITPPGVITTGNVLKSHSYLWIADGGSVPVYAPVDSQLVSGVYSSFAEQGTVDYGLVFRVSCEVEYRIGHFTDPLPRIRSAFSSEPKTNDSRDNQITPISVKAGELLGYTSGTPQAHNWDFGVYNSAKPDPDADIAIASEKDKRANCPYDYFSPELRDRYRSMLSNDFGIGGTVTVKYCD